MNTASLENCKRLYELSGWDDCDNAWVTKNAQGVGIFVGAIKWLHEPTEKTEAYPAYDSGYLLRKLPLTEVPKHVNKLNQGWELKLGWNYKTQFWYAGYSKDDKYFSWYYEADTPEDALCLLAIKLFEEGILTQ